jgi:hypothetical protein
MGDEEARRQGVRWDQAGTVEYGGAATTLRSDQHG